MLLDAASRVRHTLAGVDFDTLTPREKFEARCIELGAHVTLWLKRVRKYGCQFRYLIIAEEHNSSRTAEEMRHRPHLHLLIHERWPGAFWSATEWRGEHAFMPDKAFPREAWRLGHSRFEVSTDPRSAVYLCKYLVKEAHVRIRCSLDYGSPNPGYYTARPDSEAE